MRRTISDINDQYDGMIAYDLVTANGFKRRNGSFFFLYIVSDELSFH